MKNWMKGLLLATVAVMGLSMAGAALAGDGDLGAHWPNSADVSSHPKLHVYRWQRSGVEFVQVNDGSGAPLMAIATNGDTVVVLPIGNPDLVTIAATSAVPAGQGVYADSAVSILLLPDGFTVQPLNAAATCQDPIECSKPKVAAPAVPSTSATPVTTMSALGCNDPIECSKPVQ